MTHIWLLMWPKVTATTAAPKCTGDGEGTISATPSKTSTTPTSCAISPGSTHCHGLRKLLRKLKKQSRMMLRAAATRPSSGSTFECKYDPLSYSLNFDSSGWGSFLDGDYYQFLAFSSRFVANPTTLPPRLVSPFSLDTVGQLKKRE